MNLADFIGTKITKVNVDANFQGSDRWSEDFVGVAMELDNGKVLNIGISDEGQCCERWDEGFFFDDNIKKLIGAEITGIDTHCNDKIDIPVDEEWDEYYDRGNIIIVIAVETTAGKFYWWASNEHNGFYGHPVIINCNDGEKTKQLFIDTI